MQTKYILFLSTLNFTTNPRLYKECQLALQSGYKIKVIIFKLGNWSDVLENEKLEKLKGANIIYMSATRRPLISWVVSTILEKIMQLVPTKFNIKAAAFAHNKRTVLLLKALRMVEAESISFVVAHNLGALYPATIFSQKWGVPFGFDVEDYHPGELVTRKDLTKEVQRRVFLIQNLLPQASYATYASSLIREATESLLDPYQLPLHRETILNSFTSSEFLEPKKEISGPLRFVWFSQNITSGRGLELFLPALQQANTSIEVTLIGNLDPNFAAYLKSYPFLKMEKALPQSVLHERLQDFDIGLALEISSVDENKMMALSNKILAYKQAGLYILATDTPAQVEFLKNFAKESQVVSQQVAAISAAINELIKNTDTIRAGRQKRYRSGKGISWEKEAQKQLSCWDQVITS